MTHNYLFLFYEQYAVKKLHQQLQQDSLLSKIMDAPRKLSSECELSVTVYFDTDNTYKKYINRNIRAVYKIDKNNFEIIWQDKN